MTLRFTPDAGAMSWGRIGREPQLVAHPASASALKAWAAEDKGPRLAMGLQRSYGDSCTFTDGRLIAMRGLDRFLSFDPSSGVVTAQAGLSLGELLRMSVPRGWFAPVTPGTRHVTLGGAVANDVHGKNHTLMGSFGHHVRRITLLRSDRGVVDVTPQSEPELFAATVGGLGLTGLILEVTLQLAPITSAYHDVETLPLANLADFFAIDRESVGRFEHTVAWIDCTRRGGKVGLGVYTRASWSRQGALEPHAERQLATPFETPRFLLNPLTLKLFNQAYRLRQLAGPRRRLSHYGSVFHPLDAISGWNKLYGASGFYQYQCVAPPEQARGAMQEILDAIGRSGQGSALVVLKTFGDRPPAGLMSFPRAGYTLALDFPNKGEATRNLFARLDDIVRAAGGALYPAKDGRLPRPMLDLGYPRLERFLASRDPACGSDFSERMGL